MDSRRDFTSKKVFSGYFSELGEKANSALFLTIQLQQAHPPTVDAHELHRVALTRHLNEILRGVAF